jgi:hypothetical protein
MDRMVARSKVEHGPCDFLVEMQDSGHRVHHGLLPDVHEVRILLAALQSCA